MDLEISPSTLCGSIPAQPSKSAAHRALICAALADRPTEIQIHTLSADIRATLACLTALGAAFSPAAQGIRVLPISKPAASAVLDCGESGSTLRFLLPVAAALCPESKFLGHGRLPNRPLTPLTTQMQAHGCVFSQQALPFTVYGPLSPGIFSLPGNISSQYLSGLLFALPLLSEDSEIQLTARLESSAYVDMTLQTLRRFGVDVSVSETGYRISGASSYRSPGNLSIEGDWSNAAFFLTAALFGHSVSVTGLSPNSAQGDRAIVPLLAQFRSAAARREIDVSGIPDLVPILAVAACGTSGTTLLANAARLRLKESDRLSTTTAMLTALGAHIEARPDALVIHGGAPLHGATVDSFGDHRIAMAAAIAALLCSSAVRIRNAEAVNKSYPDFYHDFQELGGIVHGV